MTKGIIADIQRSSLHDGSGLRTTVFFKGCPLSCRWCHNPECISFEKQVLFYPEKCIGCGKCDEGCFSGAKVVCGHEMTAEEVLCDVLRDKPYYGKDGGVTFSGGEPFAQKKFLSECIDICKKNDISCAAETSLIYFEKEVFQKLDFVMADFKLWDNELHKKYTGAENVTIKENFKRLDMLDIPIIARTPLIPEVNQGLDKISEFLKGLKNVVKYEFLPYHPLGNAKRRALGKEADGFSVPSDEYIKETEKYAYIR